MAELTFDVNVLDHIQHAVLVRMQGAIDASTVVNFQSTLENLQLNGTKRFILDMEGLNSTGLGSLVRLADQLESDGGGFALVKIHPKVKVVFDMLGLNAFFKIFPNQEAAESHFGGSGGGGTATAAPPARAAANQPPPPPAAGGTARQAAPASAAPANAGTFKPRAVACQNCGVTLRIQQKGNFKCSKCGTLFTVEPTGQVTFHIQQQAAAKPKPVQLNMVCADAYTAGLAAFLGVVAQQMGFQPQRVQQLQAAVREIVQTIRTNAYGNNAEGQYSVLVAPEQGVMNMKFADRGRTLALSGTMFGQTRQAMSGFDLKPHPPGGNILTLRMSA